METEITIEGGRRLNHFWWWVVVVFSTLAIFLAVNQVFSLKIFGFMPVANAYYYYIIAFFGSLTYIIFPATKSARGKVMWYDCLLFLLCFATSLFFVANAMNILLQGWEFEAPVLAVVFSIILWGLMLEGVRRATGWALIIICLAFSIYPLFAGNMPGILEGFSFNFSTVAGYHAMSQESIIGIPLRTVGGLIIGFMIFGVALQHTGGGRFFLRFSIALLGHTRGGPAKVAILGSCLFGSMSGSALSNIITTGSMTIPTMKRIGYPAEYAAAIEAVASTGGALMPPVMGAVAFIMASMLSVPYVEIIIAAAIPALLYYLGLFLQVDSYAARVGLVGLPRGELPPITTTLKEGWFYIFSFFALIYFLIYLRLEARAPFYATALLLALSQIRKDTRFTAKSFLEFIVGTGRLMAGLTVILGAVGLLIGALSMTGVAPALSGELVMLARGNVILLLIFAAITGFILGMGVTITACYVFLAVTVAPALIKIGLCPIASHLFLVYCALISYLTPPVALSAITAASIAGCNPMKTGFLSMRLGSAIFIVPFLFIMNPCLLLMGPVHNIVFSTLTAVVGIAVMAYGLGGYLPKVGTLGPIMRLIPLACGLLLAFSGLFFR